MNELERQEIESIRLELHEIINDNPSIIPSTVFYITCRLWKLSHKKNLVESNLKKTKTRKAKLTSYFDGKEFINGEKKCLFHGFFQYQDEYTADVLAIVEFEDGIIQRIDPDYLVFEN